MHQLDRMEEMLTKLANAMPDNPDALRRSDVARYVVDLFSYILQDKKIDAIRAHRMLTGMGLKESKDAIEGLYFHLSSRVA